MGDPKGFLKITRETPGTRDPKTRLADYEELYVEFPKEKTVDQASRCMDCGVPFCHSGCPLGNVIPEFNDAVYREDWAEAFSILSSTNNFPEFTGRICPAPCEAACVLGINQPPVAIEHIEKTIVETAYNLGLVKPVTDIRRTGKKAAVVGSGPAGLAAADQLNRSGHQVTLFERNDRIGGLLRYGIPDFKLEKWVVDRRLEVMEAEGVAFVTSANIGGNIPADALLNEFDAVVLCGGSTVPRDVKGLPGRELSGIHFAMDFLEQNNRRVAGDDLSGIEPIMATGKHVVVIGGGDTGSDCVGTSNRHGAQSITQFEIMPQPPEQRDPLSWPNWPWILRHSTSHDEGCDRDWSVNVTRFIGDEAGNVRALEAVRVTWGTDPSGRLTGFKPVEGSEFEIPCDLVLLAVGFLHPQHNGMLEQLGLELDERGNVRTRNYQTSVEKVFSAGDMRRGQSLVVWAINEGREAAEAVNRYLG
ncbi:MAG: glutamate synthase subunit beta [Lewinellaceae bacterium]|nr:glutamate synthase subunit beta [Lewinella sp.]MCB9280095.1 glutamate synthase subunit beta [Lewinellaceae bacterium]